MCLIGIKLWDMRGNFEDHEKGSTNLDPEPATLPTYRVRII
jgi:hypothetical protein